MHHPGSQVPMLPNSSSNLSKMLSRALKSKPRKSSSTTEAENSFRSVSISEYEDFVIALMDDLPLISCDATDKGGCSESQLTLRQVLRSSVGVIGESRLGLTEKVVMLNGKICALKRFRKVSMRRREFGRRIVRLALVSSQCKYLVPMTAYFYTKRIKFVVCDYYPMGSLADLLGSARELGQTPLNWDQRLKIVVSIAQAIEFIHSRCSSQEKHLKMNVHGNIKASNVMVNIDFTACLSEYGFTQLAERMEVSDARQRTPQAAGWEYTETFSQKSDIYNFGVIVSDILGGPDEKFKHKKEDDLFEVCVEGKEREQALVVLDLALACTNKSPEARPTIQEILVWLDEILR